MKFMRKGSSIIEVLIAATLISIAILAALSLSSQNQKQTDFAKNLNLATFYNNESIDWLRNMRSVLGWADLIDAIDSDLVSGKANYCLNTLPTSDFVGLAYQSDCNGTYIDNKYQREMELVPAGDGNSVSVKVTTYWQERAHKVSTETTLSKW